jgi:hypothetical protein
MAGKGYGRRLTRLEEQWRCPHHRRWVRYGCDDCLDMDRLSDAEGDVLLQLAEKAGALDGPLGYGIRARCGIERRCLTCHGEYLTRSAGLERLTPEARDIVHKLVTKALTRWPAM